MLAAITKVFEDSIRIMVFCHDGLGLPIKRCGKLYLIAGITALSRLGRDYLAPEPFNIGISLAATLVYLGVLFVFMRSLPLAALLLTNLFINLAMLMLYSKGVDSIYVLAGLTLWGIAAWMVVMIRVAKKLLAAQRTLAERKQVNHEQRKPD